MSLALVVLLVLIIVALFFLAGSLFRRLETSHPETYEAMSRPSFWAPTPTNTIATLKFVFRREHKDLNDTHLSIVSDAILICCVIYVVLFAYLFSAISAAGGWRRSGHAT